MIVLSKDKILEDYFIDENSVITDKAGNVQKQYINEGRYYFKGFYVHKIMMNTFVGVRDGDYVVHHLDCNPLNNKLSNLIYLTNAEHTRLHKIGNKNLLGKHHSEQTKANMRIAHKGKKLSEETKQKIREFRKGRHHSTETKAKIRAAKQNMSVETKAKISAAKLGKQLSAETKAKLSTTNKGTKFFNDGIKNIRCKPEECPAGFVHGMIKFHKKL